MTSLSPAFLQNTGTSQTLLLVGGLACLTLWLMLRIARRRKLQAGTPTPHEQIERNRQLRGMQGDLETLMVEVEQFAKRLGAQLDAKAATVEKLLRDAEVKIEELRRLDAARSDPQGGETSAGVSKARSGTRSRPRPAAAAGRATIAATAPPADALAQRVYDLADAGHDAHEIARRLDEHIGKVELILALREAQ